MRNRISTPIFLSVVTEEEIEKIINSMKDGSPGYDDIPASLLKLALSHVKQPLVYMCNLSLSEGIFPEAMKIANVVPLFKSGNSMLFNNYRPVSLQRVLSKIFEIVMYKRLNDFFVISCDFISISIWF